jgi:hypothetical protein
MRGEVWCSYSCEYENHCDLRCDALQSGASAEHTASFFRKNKMVVFRCNRHDINWLHRPESLLGRQQFHSPAHTLMIDLLSSSSLHRHTNCHNTSPAQSAMCHSYTSPWSSYILSLQCFTFRPLTLLLYSLFFFLVPLFIFLFILLSIFLSLFLFLCFFFSLGLYVSMNIVQHF